MDRIERTLRVDAPAEEVWESLTDPERLGEWLGEVEIDLRPGGELAARTGEGDERHGFVEDVEEGRRLSFWWTSDDDEPSTRVEIEIDEGEGRTVVTVAESRPLVALDLGPDVLWAGRPPTPELSAAAR